MAKTIKIRGYKRTPPKSPAWDGRGRKPGPKTVNVDPHKRSKPDK